MKITDALIAEHRSFLFLFDFVEETLPTLNDLPQAQLLGRLLERLLQAHARAEEELFLVALDHVLEDKGERNRFHQEHQEIDARLKESLAAADIGKASQALKVALAASRKHFKHEETTVFPLAEKTMRPETLVKLGAAFLERPRP